MALPLRARPAADHGNVRIRRLVHLQALDPPLPNCINFYFCWV
jgi:hypothetical protein